MCIRGDAGETVPIVSGKLRVLAKKNVIFNPPNHQPNCLSMFKEYRNPKSANARWLTGYRFNKFAYEKERRWLVGKIA
jgi:hypothetical protein